MLLLLMTVSEAKKRLKNDFSYIKLEYNSKELLLTLKNLVYSKRFGMGYAWHAFLTLSGNDVVKARFECHTSDTSTGVFHQKLPAPPPVWDELRKVCEVLELNLGVVSAKDDGR